MRKYSRSPLPILMEAGRFDLALFAHRATGRALRLAHGPVRSSNQNSEAAAALQRPKPGLQCVRALSVEARTSHGTEFLLQDIKGLSFNKSLKAGDAGQGPTNTWVLVKGFNLSYHNEEILSFNIDPYDGNFNLTP